MVQKFYKQRFVVAIGAIVFLVTLMMFGMTRLGVLAQDSGPIVGDGLMVEAIARSTKQIPLGVYDDITNKTYVVFPGCINSADPCSVDPYITYYDHTTKMWADKMRLGESGPGNAPEGGRYDSHTYPQIIIDDNRHMHVFNSQHHTSPIQHYFITDTLENVNVLDGYDWDVADISSDGPAAYAIAIKTHDGDIYLFYRRTENEETFYSPFAYVKSTDHGFNWSFPQDIIDPGDPSIPAYNTGWNTIYVKGIYYQATPERLHMVFGVHKHHNQKIDKLFYTYFDFDDEHMYAPDGEEIGQMISATAILSNYHNIQIFSEGEITSAYRTAAIGINPKPAGDTVNIFHSTAESGSRSIDRLIWNGAGWDRVHLFWNEDEYHVDPQEVRFLGPDQFELYVRKLGVAELPSGAFKSSIERWVGTATGPTTCSWQTSTIASRNDPDNMLVLRSFIFVQNALPTFKATYIEGGQYTDYISPTNTGVLWAWGESYNVYLPIIMRAMALYP